MDSLSEKEWFIALMLTFASICILIVIIYICCKHIGPLLMKYRYKFIPVAKQPDNNGLQLDTLDEVESDEEIGTIESDMETDGRATNFTKTHHTE